MFHIQGEKQFAVKQKQKQKLSRLALKWTLMEPTLMSSDNNKRLPVSI